MLQYFIRELGVLKDMIKCRKVFANPAWFCDNISLLSMNFHNLLMITKVKSLLTKLSIVIGP